MVGRRGKKNAGSTSLEKIGPALIPAAALAAVPHSPPPRPLPGTPLTLASAVFGSSFSVNRAMMVPAAPGAGAENDGAFSDPESSLYDYQQMEEAGYSSVGFGTWPNQNRKSYSERERAPTPPFVKTATPVGVISQTGGVYHILEPEEEDLSDQDLYAVPLKGKGLVKEKSQTTLEDDATSMDRTQKAVRQAMQDVHDMPVEETVMRRSQNRQTSASSSGRGTMRKEDFDGADGDVADDIREGAAAARADNQNDVRVSHDQETDLKEEAYVTLKKQTDTQGGSGSGRLSSRLSHTPRNAASMSLELEVHRLKEENQWLHNEVLNLRKVAAAIRVGDQEGAQTILENHQLEELREENEVLKNAVGKLNQELSQYQAKFRPLSEEEQSRLQGLPSEGPVPSWLINKRYLAPLFLAYDDLIAEKEEIIVHCQEELRKLKERIEEVVRENQRLQLKGGGGGTGQLSSSEWQQLQEQARLVLEENQILVEQLDIQQSKVKDLCASHMQEVSRFNKKLTVSETEKEETERELEDLKRKFKDVKHKYDHIVLEMGSHMTMQDHIHSVADLKRSVTEEREQMEKEKEKMANKLKASEEERKQQTMATIDLSTENKQLRAEIKALHRAVKRGQNKMLILQKAIQQSENKELITQNELANVIRIVEKTALERDTAFKVVKEQQQDCKETVNRMVGHSVVMGKMEEKLKMYKIKAAAKLESVAQKLKEQDEAFNRQRQEYEREIRYLRLLVKEKEETIRDMEGTKKEVEEDLEAMWQAASSENQRLKDVLRKSVHRLRDHPSLKAALDEQQELEELVLLKDE